MALLDNDTQVSVLVEGLDHAEGIACPTNIAFCGRELDILLSANLGRWHITRYEAGAVGLALHYPNLG